MSDASARSRRRRTLLKYLVLQIPGLALVAVALAAAVWVWDLSPLLAGGLLLLWIAKDAAMYPVVRVAYEPVEHDPAVHLVGCPGVAQGELAPEGWVQVGAELWRARSDADAIESGAAIRVVDVDGMTLRVEPEPEGIAPRELARPQPEGRPPG